jgi:predicted transcriptional regulator
LTSNRKEIQVETAAFGIGDVKGRLVEHIHRNPGIRYRELSRLTGLSNGVLTHHLSVLKTMSQIRIDRQQSNRVTRYYTLNVSRDESQIIGCIRNKISRQITMYIIENDLCTFNEIVDHIRKSPSTLSWYLKRLKYAGIVSVTRGEERQLYTIIDHDTIAHILFKYEENFTDKIVDNYTGMMEEL